MTKNGFVLFDDETAHDTGWVLAEGEPLQRISGTAELSSDTVWWTNLSYETANLSGLQGARFRRGTYFSHDIHRIWQELGVDEGPEQPIRVRCDSVFEGACESSLHLRLHLANWVFRKTMEVTSDFLPLTVPPLNDLAHGIRERIFPDWNRFFVDEPPPEFYRDALEAANKAYQPVPRMVMQESGESILPKTLRLPVDRAYHAWMLLHMPVPIGGWRNLQDGVRILNRKPDGFVRQWLLENPGALLRVTMKRCSEEMEPIVNYGANIDRNARSGHWLTSVELESLMDHCEFNLHEGVLAEKVLSPLDFLEKQGLRPEHLTEEILAARAPSYPFHIFMDNLWRAFCGPIPRAPKGQKNPFAAFLRSADRMVLMQRAAILHRKGIQVVGYGSGGVLIQPPKSDPRNWVADILSAGLLPPLFPAGTFALEEVEDMVDLYQPETGLFSNTSFLQTCLLMGDLNSLVYLGEELSLFLPEVQPIEETANG